MACLTSLYAGDTMRSRVLVAVLPVFIKGLGGEVA
jgi:hypothetical protein